MDAVMEILVAVVGLFLGLAGGYGLALRLGAAREALMRADLLAARATIDRLQVEAASQLAALRTTLAAEQGEERRHWRDETDRLRTGYDQAQRACAAAETLAEQTHHQLAAAEAARRSAEMRTEEARALEQAARLESVRARQEVDAMRRQMADWEKTKAEFMQSTQASVLETAQQISSKLLEDHKRETAAAALAGEEMVKKTTEILTAEVGELSDGLSQLKGQVREKTEVIDTVYRALSSPGGAGYFAEIGLANLLTGFGLVQDRDFKLQNTLYGADGTQRLRPDALIFLPGESTLVIDAKASKHLLALAEAEGGPDEALAYQALARTMNQHLKDLSARDYRSAVESGYRKAGRPDIPARILTVMYVPNDGALEKLIRADPDFARKSAEAQIIPAGPAGLACIIGFASVEVSLMRQIENQERIVEKGQQLLDAIAIALGYAGSVGKGIRQSAEAFAKLSSSINGRLLPRARELQRLGLRPGKPIPGNLSAYQVVELGQDVIEAEAVEQHAAPMEIGHDG